MSDHIDEQTFLRSQCVVLLTRPSLLGLSAIPVKAGAWVEETLKDAEQRSPNDCVVRESGSEW